MLSEITGSRRQMPGVAHAMLGAVASGAVLLAMDVPADSAVHSPVEFIMIFLRRQPYYAFLAPFLLAAMLVLIARLYVRGHTMCVIARLSPVLAHLPMAPAAAYMHGVLGVAVWVSVWGQSTVGTPCALWTRIPTKLPRIETLTVTHSLLRSVSLSVLPSWTHLPPITPACPTLVPMLSTFGASYIVPTLSAISPDATSEVVAWAHLFVGTLSAQSLRAAAMRPLVQSLAVASFFFVYCKVRDPLLGPHHHRLTRSNSIHPPTSTLPLPA